MRITDATVVLHERSASGAASFGPAGRWIPLGVLCVATDEGIKGNAFLSASPRASVVSSTTCRQLGNDSGPLIRSP